MQYNVSVLPVASFYTMIVTIFFLSEIGTIQVKQYTIQLVLHRLTDKLLKILKI